MTTTFASDYNDFTQIDMHPSGPEYFARDSAICEGRASYRQALIIGDYAGTSQKVDIHAYVGCMAEHGWIRKPQGDAK